jgi:hypothetical protein
MKKILSFILAGFTALSGWSQLAVEASEDQFVCGPQQVTLTATAPAVPSTSAYTVSSIPWAPEVIGGTNVTLSDDAVSGALPIGFTFCFLGSSYTQFILGRMVGYPFHQVSLTHIHRALCRTPGLTCRKTASWVHGRTGTR